MSKIVATFVAAAAVSFAGAASAQNCAGLLNTQIAPVSFDAATRLFSGGSGAAITKDEFETTAQFEARQAAARSNMPASLFVSLPVDMDQIAYNADTGAFEIKTYAVANIGADWFTVFYGSPYYNTMGTGIIGSALAVVLSSEDRPTGTHMGKNGYGAEWEITEVHRDVNIIFEGKPANYGSTLFQNNSGPAPIWSLPVPVAEARAFKPKIHAAALIAPKAPYYFENTQDSTARITVQNPRDLTQESHVIVADIQCVVITDDVNNVVLAVSTN